MQTVSIIEKNNSWLDLSRLAAVWQYRELLYFLVWRDVKIRYKQTVLGIVWIMLQPLVSIAIFSLIFGYLLNVPSDGIPYPVFAYSALLPWNYFASSLSKASTSLVGNANLVSKIYFPRLIIPISGVLSGLVDFAISFVILIGLMLFYQVPLTTSIFTLPIILLLGLITALGFSLWLSALNVRYRDINYVIPFLIQVWMYLTPVIYSSSLIPENYRFLLALNPMTLVVEGFRWALLGAQRTQTPLSPSLSLISIAITVLIFISGIVFFHKVERTFADIV